MKPQLVIEYAQEVQKVAITPERAQVIVGELDRLVAGSLRAAEQLHVADDPADFLAALAELRDLSDA